MAPVTSMESLSGDSALERLVRLEVKLDMALAGREDHETRLRRVERTLWIASGAAATVGGGIGSVIATLMS